MKDVIFAFIHQYAVWGILLVTFLSVILLHCVYRQMRKLNRSLGMVTAKVQQYFDIIMNEEEETEEPEGARELHREEPERARELHREEPERRYRPREEDFQLTRGEREMLLSDRPDRKKSKRQEEVLDAVLQEYFS